MKSPLKTNAPPSVTHRERQVLRLWGQYMNTALIAQELKVSEHTINTHLKRARKKMGVKKTILAWRCLEQRGGNTDVTGYMDLTDE